MDNELVALLRELVSTPSMNPYTADTLEPGYGEAQVAERVAAFLRRAGVAVELREVRPGRPNVVASLDGPGGGDPLLFVAHLDTVPVEGMTVPPFEAKVDGGRLYGRGACDNKGSLAAMLTALTRVAEKKANHCPLLLVATMDEESSYGGIRAFLADGPRARAAVVGEPTQLEVVVAHKGALRCAIATHGKSAHSSHPDQGVNAIYRMMPLVADLEALAQELPTRAAHPLVGPPTLSVGTIHGGLTINTVPDRCTIEVDRRLLPGESVDEAAAEIQAIVERHGATTHELFTGLPFEVSQDAEVVGLASAAAAAVLGEAKVVGVPYGTEASAVLRAGIPAVVLGPGDAAQAHSADEWVDLAQLDAAARIYQHIMTTAAC